MSVDRSTLPQQAKKLRTTPVPRRRGLGDGGAITAVDLPETAAYAAATTVAAAFRTRERRSTGAAVRSLDADHLGSSRAQLLQRRRHAVRRVCSIHIRGGRLFAVGADL